jgi:cytidylate kinase
MQANCNIKIALSGKSGSGKTELSTYLCNKLGIQRCSTGDIYRQICKIIFGTVSKEQMNNLTKALRNMDTNCIIQAAFRFCNPRKGIVFDSMRFAEDYEHLKAAGFLLVRIDAVPAIRFVRLKLRNELFNANSLEEDLTETALDNLPYDIQIRNDSDCLEVFLTEAYKAISAIIGALNHG